MKKVFKKTAIVFLTLIALSIIVYIKLQPIRQLNNFTPYSGTTNFHWKYPPYHNEKKTVIIMADNDMTELFDFLAPYYLFSETGKANVFVVAHKKYPILTKNGPFILPHFTYSEIDSLKIRPDVIVIPYMHSPASPVKTNWLKNHYSDSVIILSICDGAWTAAASGIYDGVPLTSHATGHDKLKKKFSKPLWVQNVSITQSGNLFSTGGVSNATDGSLAVIENLFGSQEMLRILKNVNYPHDNIQKSHVSKALDASGKLSVLKKVLFSQNKTIGVLLQNGVSEMELATVFDVYARTMPSSIQGIIAAGNAITTKHGLTVISSGKIIPEDIDELHVLKPGDVSKGQLAQFKIAAVMSYDNQPGNYIMDVCLKAIEEQYGQSFYKFVKLTLDYN